MTPSQHAIIAAGRALYGERWKSALAADLGVSRDSVDDWSTGRMRPRLGVWEDVAALLTERIEAIDTAGARVQEMMRA